MRDARSLLLDAVMTANWAIHRPVLDNLTMIVLRHSEGVRLSQAEIDQVVASRSAGPGAGVGSGGDRGYDLRGSVAVIPVGGVIAKHARMVNGASQPRGTATQTIAAAVQAAQDDPSVGSILLHVESPGGTVDGVEALAEQLYGMRSGGHKPVWALASDMMASAAYWIGSQASRLYAETKTTEVGSIGVYVAVPDYSRLYENEGVRVNLIASGPDKGAGVPGTPITDAHKALWQERVDGIADVFKQAAARGRGMAMEAMNKAATGRVYGAEDAQRLGLIDGVMSAGQVIAEMNRLYPSPRGKSGNAPAASGARPAEMIMDPTTLQGQAGAAPAAPGTPAQAPGASSGQTTTGTAPATLGAAAGSSSAAAPAQPALRLAGTEVDQALAANEARIRDIQTRARPWLNHPQVGTFVQELVNRAATDRTITAEAFNAQVMNKLQEQLAPTGATISVGADGFTRQIGATQAVLLERLSPEVQSIIEGRPIYDASVRGEQKDRSDQIARRLGYADAKGLREAYNTHASDGVRGQSLVELAFQSLQAAGMAAGLSPSNPRHRDRIAQLALGMPAIGGYGASATGHARSDFPFLMAETMNRSLLAAGGAVEQIYPEIAYIGEANDFRAQGLGDVSAVGDFEEIKPGGRPKHGTASDRSESISIKTFGKAIKFTRVMIVNDDLNGIALILQRVGEAAARLPDQRLTKKLTDNPNMSDGVALFHATHKNLANPAAALSSDAVKVGINAMRQQTSFGKGATVKMPVTPTRIMTPTVLSWTAQEIFRAQFDPTRSATNANQAPNLLQGRLRPIENPYLDDYSLTAWYLLADPRVRRLMQINFLNGMRTPIVSLVGDGTILERNYEVIYDCEVVPVEWEAGYKNNGA